jgi:hypothetical protein
MRHQWRLRRTFQEHQDGQRRWDRAYQLLLEWGQAPDAPRLDPSQRPSIAHHQLITTPVEVPYACSDLCSGLDPAPNPDAAH